MTDYSNHTEDFLPPSTYDGSKMRKESGMDIYKPLPPEEVKK